MNWRAETGRKDLNISAIEAMAAAELVPLIAFITPIESSFESSNTTTTTT